MLNIIAVEYYTARNPSHRFRIFNATVHDLLLLYSQDYLLKRLDTEGELMYRRILIIAENPNDFMAKFVINEYATSFVEFVKKKGRYLIAQWDSTVPLKLIQADHDKLGSLKRLVDNINKLRGYKRAQLIQQVRLLEPNNKSHFRFYTKKTLRCRILEHNPIDF